MLALLALLPASNKAPALAATGGRATLSTLCYSGHGVEALGAGTEGGGEAEEPPGRGGEQGPAGTRTRPDTRYFIRYPTRFSFENHRVAGNPKYRVLPDISGKPGVSGVTRYFG